jgi:hypothetical protein
MCCLSGRCQVILDAAERNFMYLHGRKVGETGVILPSSACMVQCGSDRFQRSAGVRARVHQHRVATTSPVFRAQASGDYRTAAARTFDRRSTPGAAVPSSQSLCCVRFSLGLVTLASINHIRRFPVFTNNTATDMSVRVQHSGLCSHHGFDSKRPKSEFLRPALF